MNHFNFEFVMELMFEAMEMVDRMDYSIKPQKEESINGAYILRRNIGTYKEGQIFDSQAGYVHGIWHNKEVIRFDNNLWFIKL